MKQKKKALLSLLLSLAVLLSLVACGASNAAGGNFAADASAAEMAVASEPAEVEKAEESWSSTSYAYDEADTTSDDAVAGEGGAYDQSKVKLIYTASLEVEVLDFDQAVAGLNELVEELGGYFQSSNLYGYGSRRSASYTVRVPSEHYRAFVDAWSDTDNCHLLSRSEDVQDVGEAYFDAETRLTTLRTKMERLQSLLSQATEMEDIITIETAISETEYEIERYTSTLNRYDSLIGYATVDIYLDEVVNLTEEEEQSFLDRLGQNLRWGAEHFVDGLADLTVWAAYNIIGIVIFLVLAAVVIVTVRRTRKKRKAKKLYGQPKENPASVAPAEEKPEEK